MLKTEIVVSVFPSLFIYLGTFILITIDTYVTKAKKRCMYRILILSLFYYIFETLERLFVEESIFHYGRLIFSVMSYCIAPVTILEFYFLITKKKKYDNFLWILPGIQAGIFIYSLFSQLSNTLPNLGLEFTFDNQFDFGMLYPISVIVPIVISSMGIYSVAVEYKHKTVTSGEMFMVCFLSIGNLIAWILESFIPGIRLVGLTAFISVDIYFAFLYIHYFRIHEEEVLKKYEIEVIISQIHPHFIYNTLNSIYHLCGKNDELAKRTIDDFSTYLRRNLKSLSGTEFIPIEEEIAHTKTYLSIEQLRFGERLHYDFCVECDSFQVPPLILQPIVENAVKHGICKKEEGGTVRIHIYQNDGKKYIEVTDDGVGFDAKSLSFDNGSHIGFANTKERVEKLLFGTMKIESETGVGTKAVITF